MDFYAHSLKITKVVKAPKKPPLVYGAFHVGETIEISMRDEPLMIKDLDKTVLWSRETVSKP